MINVHVNKKYVIQARDIAKGIVLAAIAGVAPVIEKVFESGELVFNWKAIGVTAIGAGFAYVIKQFFSESKVITTYSNNADAEAVATDLKQQL